MKQVFIALSFLLLCFHIQAQENKTKAPVIVVKLIEGEKLKVEDAFLHFEKVVSDSRCPSDATCVWEGEAKVKLFLKKDGELVEGKEITLPNGPKDFRDETVFNLGGKAFQIYALKPYPTSKMKTEGKIEYYLQIEHLKETKSNSASNSSSTSEK